MYICIYIYMYIYVYIYIYKRVRLTPSWAFGGQRSTRPREMRISEVPMTVLSSTFPLSARSASYRVAKTHRMP